MDSSQHRTYPGAHDILASWEPLIVHHASSLLPDLPASPWISSPVDLRRVALHTSWSITYAVIWRYALRIIRCNRPRKYTLQVITRIIMRQYVRIVGRSVVVNIVAGHSRNMATLLCNFILPQQWRSLSAAVPVFTIEQFN